MEDLRAHQDDVDWERAQEIEAELRHDLMAEVRAYAEQCPVGGPIIHLGATSMDIEDNADALRLREALGMVHARLAAVLAALAERIEAEADTPIMAYTHLQPAEPTTLGYRLSLYAQDLLDDYRAVAAVRERIRGKGFKGAVGTSASYGHLLEGRGITPQALEERIMAQLGLPAFPVTSQTYPRKMDFQVLSVLASIAQSAHKFALDLRLLQSPLFGELAEPWALAVGSSAMPFKRNPVASETICSLARAVAGCRASPGQRRPLGAGAHPGRFGESAQRPARGVPGGGRDPLAHGRHRARAAARVRPWPATWRRNGPWPPPNRCSWRVVAGADRQAMHERIRDNAMAAWRRQRGADNPLVDLLAADGAITRYLAPDEVRRLMREGAGVGDAPQRAAPWPERSARRSMRWRAIPAQGRLTWHPDR